MNIHQLSSRGRVHCRRRLQSKGETAKLLVNQEHHFNSSTFRSCSNFEIVQYKANMPLQIEYNTSLHQFCAMPLSVFSCVLECFLLTLGLHVYIKQAEKHVAG